MYSDIFSLLSRTTQVSRRSNDSLKLANTKRIHGQVGDYLSRPQREVKFKLLGNQNSRKITCMKPQQSPSSQALTQPFDNITLTALSVQCQTILQPAHHTLRRFKMKVFHNVTCSMGQVRTDRSDRRHAWRKGTPQQEVLKPGDKDVVNNIDSVAWPKEGEIRETTQIRVVRNVFMNTPPPKMPILRKPGGLCAYCSFHAASWRCPSTYPPASPGRLPGSF